jgi:tRNA A-37 threonylcarbamoyl transferase component Bud32
MDSIGRYRIIGELGRGAMGVVYHATDPAIGRSVAIKTIRIHDIHDKQQREKLRERLFREARSAGVLSHPNIVTIYDMDEVDGLAYIAMAYVNGPTLEKILASQTPLSGVKMLRILRQAASALDYAHGRGIVHRDVKPANIMTDEDGAVKITDFGIAKITAPGDATETKTVVGTPNYMSPEQVQGLPVDGRSDQFSLAVIAYEILTGERPFQGEHLSTVVYKIVAEEPERAQQINGTLTARIDEVLRRALSKKPEDRYPNCANFVGALEMACAESRGWKTLAAGSAAAMTTIAVDRPLSHGNEGAPTFDLPAPPSGGRPDWETPQRTSRFVPVMLSVIVALGLVGAVMWQAGGLPGLPNLPNLAGLLSFWQSRTDGPQASATPAQEPTTAPQDQPPPAADQTPAQAPASTPAPEPQSAAAADQQPQQAAAAPTAPVPAAQPPVRKPSPLGPRTGDGVAANKTPIGAPPAQSQETVRMPRGRNAPQDLWVTTNPPGAKVVLDDNLGQSCQTPCMLHGPAGVHHLTVSQAGYLNEYREIHVGDTAQDVPLISLREASGTLMVTTVPPGASVRINGQLVQQVTPAAITLRPGTYSVTVEKGGRTQTERVEVQQSPVYMQIPLGQ